jgi:hypothetical protein
MPMANRTTFSSHRQDALRSALEGFGRDVRVTLECKPDNAFHPNAVAVKVDGRHVGHLARDTAKRYRPLIAAAPTPLIVTIFVVGLILAFVVGYYEQSPMTDEQNG